MQAVSYLTPRLVCRSVVMPDMKKVVAMSSPRPTLSSPMHSGPASMRGTLRVDPKAVR